MTKINNDSWKEFKLKDLFIITGSKTTPKKDMNLSDNGQYPYITTAATNNGVFAYSDKYTEQGNCLTIDSAVLGSCFYQETNFTASDHVEKLVPKFKMSKNVALFLVSILNKNNIIFNYAYNEKRSQKALKRESVYLPVTQSGEPDWDYMENYIKEQFVENKNKLINIQNFSNKPKTKINTDSWKEFLVGGIIQRKKIKSISTIIRNFKDGNCNVIGNTSINNGIKNKFEIKDKEYIHLGNSLSYGAKGGLFFFQQENWASTDHVHMFVSPHLNETTGLFLCSILNNLVASKGGWSSSLESNIINFKIKLPVTQSGEPDWDYMENYINQIRAKQVQKLDLIKQITKNSY